MRLYICGPVTGRPDRNRIEFDNARRILTGAGFDVTVPLDIVPADEEWKDAMRQCIKTLMDCDGVAMLADWRASNGACTEVRVAQDVLMECKTVGAWVKTVMQHA